MTKPKAKRTRSDSLRANGHHAGGTAAPPRLRVRVLAESVVAMGPGKAELLRAIAEHGSIAGAARSMSMSYRRAWLLVTTMNSAFREPLVHAEKGGNEHGGTTLTTLGKRVLVAYDALQAQAERAFRPLLKPN